MRSGLVNSFGRDIYLSKGVIVRYIPSMEMTNDSTGDVGISNSLGLL
jgi:hypothetical protein